MLFASKNPAEFPVGTVKPRSVGLAYKFAHPMFIVGADLQNNSLTKNAAFFTIELAVVHRHPPDTVPPEP